MSRTEIRRWKRISHSFSSMSPGAKVIVQFRARLLEKSRGFLDFPKRLANHFFDSAQPFFCIFSTIFAQPFSHKVFSTIFFQPFSTGLVLLNLFFSTIFDWIIAPQPFFRKKVLAHFFLTCILLQKQQF